MFTDFNPCYPFLPSFAYFYQFLLILTLLTDLYRVLPSFTEFYRVLPSFAEFCRVLPSFADFCRVLPSFTEFYRVKRQENSTYWNDDFWNRYGSDVACRTRLISARPIWSGTVIFYLISPRLLIKCNVGVARQISWSARIADLSRTVTAGLHSYLSRLVTKRFYYRRWFGRLYWMPLAVFSESMYS